MPYGREPMEMLELIRETATREHCRQLAPRMKEADIQEVRRASGLTPLEALETSLDLSREANAFILRPSGLKPKGPPRVALKPKVVAISGVAPHPKEGSVGTVTCGIVWALTASLSGWEKTFWKTSQELILEYEKKFLLLMNFCDVDNKETIRYLKRLGFVFIRRVEEFGVEKRPFYQFVRISSE